MIYLRPTVPNARYSSYDWKLRRSEWTACFRYESKDFTVSAGADAACEFGRWVEVRHPFVKTASEFELPIRVLFAAPRGQDKMAPP